MQKPAYQSEIQPDIPSQAPMPLSKRQRMRRRQRPIASSSLFRKFDPDAIQDVSPRTRQSNGTDMSRDAQSSSGFNSQQASIEYGGTNRLFRRDDASDSDESLNGFSHPTLHLGVQSLDGKDRYEGQMKEDTGFGLGVMSCADGSKYACQVVACLSQA